MKSSLWHILPLIWYIRKGNQITVAMVTLENSSSIEILIKHEFRLHFPRICRKEGLSSILPVVAAGTKTSWLWNLTATPFIKGMKNIYRKVENHDCLFALSCLQFSRFVLTLRTQKLFDSLFLGRNFCTSTSCELHLCYQQHFTF